MLRRTVLASLAAALPATIAGCTGSESPTPGTATTDQPTATPAEPTGDETPDSSTVTPGRVTATLLPRDACPDPGSATVSFDDGGTVSAVGCVVGKNACTVPRLQDVSYDRTTGVATVVVAAVEEREPDEACAEVLVNLGYEVDVDTAGVELVGVTVVHDDVDGRRTVADVTR